MPGAHPFLVTIGHQPLAGQPRQRDQPSNILAMPGLHLQPPAPDTARSPFSFREDAVDTAVNNIMDCFERLSPSVPVQVGLILACNAASLSESYFASLLLSTLRDTLPKSCLVACPMHSVPPSPHISPLSPYATVLGHATAMEHADAIVVAASEDLLRAALDHVFSPPTPRNVTLIDDQLVSVTRPMLLFDLVAASCPVPKLKYLNVAMSKPQRVYPGAVPDANEAVVTLTDSLRRVPNVRPSTLAATLHASSHIAINNPTWSWAAVRDKLSTKLRFTPASFDRETSHGFPLYCRLVTYLSSRKLLPELGKPSGATTQSSKAPSAQLSLMYNSASVTVNDLTRMAVTATRKAHAGAFLHHLPSEIADEWIPDACEAVWECVSGYREYLP